MLRKSGNSCTLNKALDEIPVLELRGVICQRPTGSPSVTCYLTQVNVPRLNPRARFSWWEAWGPAIGVVRIEDGEQRVAPRQGVAPPPP